MSYDWVQLLLGSAVVVAVAWCVVLPLIVRWVARLPAHPEYRELDLRAIDAGAAEFLRSRTEPLLALGFHAPALFEIPNLGTAGSTSYVILLTGPAAGEVAMVSDNVTRAGGVDVRATYVEFGTRFETGEDINTANTTDLPPFPPPANTVRTMLPSLTDATEVYAVHRYLVARGGPPGGTPAAIDLTDPAGFLTEEAVAGPCREQVRRGRLYHDRAGDCYRLTVVGAYHMALRLMPPFGTVHRALILRRERKLLAEFYEARRAAG